MILNRTKTFLAVVTITLVTGCSSSTPDVHISTTSNDTENSITIGKNSGSGNVSISDNSGNINIQKKSSNSNNVIINSNSGNIEINGIDYSTDIEDFFEETMVKTDNVETHGHVEDVIEIAFYEKNINVNILPSDSDDIELKLSGTVPKDGDVKLSPDLLNGLLIINVEGDLRNCNLTCSIGIPQKQFKNLIIEAENGNIKAIGDEINIDQMCFTTTNGNVKTTNIFAEVFSITTENGNINSVLNATQDVMISYSSQNGNIDVDMQNVKSLDASIYTNNGRIKNNFVTNGKYTVDGVIHTSNGNIEIN